MSRERVVVVITRIQLSKTHDERKYFKLMGSLQSISVTKVMCTL